METHLMSRTFVNFYAIIIWTGCGHGSINNFVQSMCLNFYHKPGNLNCVPELLNMCEEYLPPCPSNFMNNKNYLFM